MPKTLGKGKVAFEKWMAREVVAFSHARALCFQCKAHQSFPLTGELKRQETI